MCPQGGRLGEGSDQVSATEGQCCVLTVPFPLVLTLLTCVLTQSHHYREKNTLSEDFLSGCLLSEVHHFHSVWSPTFSSSLTLVFAQLGDDSDRGEADTIFLFLWLLKYL